MSKYELFALRKGKRARNIMRIADSNTIKKVDRFINKFKINISEYKYLEVRQYYDLKDPDDLLDIDERGLRYKLCDFLSDEALLNKE